MTRHYKNVVFTRVTLSPPHTHTHTNTHTHTTVDVEHSHTVDIAINTNTLSFTSYDTLTVNWSPELFLPPTLFPTATPTNYRVDIILYELDLVNNQWTERTTLLSNTANDGTETIKVTEPSVMTSDIAPVVIKVRHLKDMCNCTCLVL